MNRRGESVREKLEILADAAKYDASCASSGVERSDNGDGIGNSSGVGICHGCAPDGDELEEMWRRYDGALFNPTHKNEPFGQHRWSSNSRRTNRLSHLRFGRDAPLASSS